MLGQWWRDHRMPKVDQLTPAQARVVLDAIAELEWMGRPFEAVAS